ncbi:MAG: hypothetical protein ACI86H_001495, partial [bacterium]
MSTEGKVLQLIRVSEEVSVDSLESKITTDIQEWGDHLRKLQEQCFEQHFDSSASDVQEIMLMRRCLHQHIKPRFEEVQKLEEEKRLKQLQMLLPFYLEDGLKNFFLHFFQFEKESTENNNIFYREKNTHEKELCILLDMYKLRKTIESVTTLQRAVEKNPFPSIFSIEDQKKSLLQLKTAYQLLFQRCIKKEFQKELYQGLSLKHLTAKEIVKRKEQNISYVYPHLLEKFDYRNQFFLIYFSEGMRAKIQGKVKEFPFNFLDFELIKQEFLLNWVHQKLKNVPEKEKVYSNYVIGENKLSELIKKNPSKEIEYLQKLPSNIFNDIMAQINETLPSSKQSGVTINSQKAGDFAKAEKIYNKSKELISKSIDNLKSFFSSNSSKNKTDGLTAQKNKTVEEEIVEKEVPVETSYNIIRLKKNEIDFPYFQRELSNHQAKIAQFRIQMGGNFQDFGAKITKMLKQLPEDNIVKRRTPKHEWTVPYLIEEIVGDKKTKHLVVLGAEAKNKKLGVSYSSGSAVGSAAQFSFIPFFVYATEAEE